MSYQNTNEYQLNSINFFTKLFQLIEKYEGNRNILKCDCIR